MNPELSVDLLAFASLALLAIGAVVLAEWARSQDILSLPASRRFVHFTVGLFVAIAVIALASPIWLFASAAVAAMVNVVSIRKGWLASIHGSDERSMGTVTFPLGVLVILPFLWNFSPVERYPLALGFTVLAIADPVAAIVGSRFKDHGLLGAGPEGKSLAGAAAFALAAWLITGLWIELVSSVGRLPFDPKWAWPLAGMVSITASTAEMVGRRGWDNLLIVVAVVLVIMAVDSEARVQLLGWSILAATVFSVAAHRLRFVRTDGAILMGLLGGSILFFGGWLWFVPPVVFFVSASLVSIWSKGRRGTALGQERGIRRDAVQVLANGGAGCCLAVLSHFVLFPAAYWLFAGSFAAAASDTFATEVGTAVGRRTWSIVSARAVEPGTSGGVSSAGFLAALAGGLIVAFAATVPMDGEFIWAVIALTAAGFLAAGIDSLLGATLQARYRTAEGRITDAAVTSGTPNRKIAGLPFIDNDTVNFLCTVAGALITWALFPGA